jgi:glutathione S-transferase
MAERPVLGYWNVQGRAAPIRFLLTHLGVDFQDKHHHFAEAPNFVD